MDLNLSADDAALQLRARRFLETVLVPLEEVVEPMGISRTRIALHCGTRWSTAGLQVSTTLAWTVDAGSAFSSRC